MSLWTRKSTDTNRTKNYVVIKHKLRDMNAIIHGVKFRNGYGVVDKNTKRYRELKRLALLKNAQEFPLEFLQKLRFVTRNKDVNLIWGKDIYYHYIKAITEVNAKEEKEQKIKDEEYHIEESTSCNYRLDNGNLCKRDAIPNSPSKYCIIHIMKDEKLEEVGIERPKGLMSKKEKSRARQIIAKKLQSLK